MALVAPDEPAESRMDAIKVVDNSIYDISMEALMAWRCKGSTIEDDTMKEFSLPSRRQPR